MQPLPGWSPRQFGVPAVIGEDAVITFGTFVKIEVLVDFFVIVSAGAYPGFEVGECSTVRVHSVQKILRLCPL